MAMVVKNNLSAVRTLNILNSNSSALQKGMARVSSGMKITGAQDDAAGFAISERMRVRIRALDQANQNSQNDSSLMKTAEGAVGNTIDILKALKEKCINAANDSNTDEDRQTIQKEINQYIDQIDDNALVTFNGKTLVDGTKNNAATATKTILLNQSLKAGTLAADKLTSLANRAGDSLGIQSTDYYQVSWVENGKIHTTSGQVGTNSIKDILSTPDVNGEKLQATVAATSKGGLIGTTEEDTSLLKGYKETSMDQVYNAEKLTSAQLTTMFGDVALADEIAASTDDADTFTIEGYYTAPVDANGDATAAPTAQTITVTFHTDGSGNYYSVSGVQVDGTDVDEKDAATKLYRKASLDTSYAESDGTAKSSDGYIDAPTDTSDTITSTNTVAFSSFTLNLASEIPTAGDSIDLAKEGYYYVSSVDATTGKPTEYTLASGVITHSGSNVTFSSDTTLDKKLYKLDLTQDAVAGSKVTVTGNAANSPVETVAVPNTISVEFAPDPTVQKEKDVPDKYNKDVFTPDKTYGVAVVAKTAGVDNQISGLTISILDQDLNVKKAANAALDQFKQYQRAENKTGDQALNFQLGSEANQAIKVGFSDMRAQALGLKGADGTRINVYTKENANASINVIENALTKALDQQTTIGAVESRLEYTSANLTTASENVQASESTIRDADMAKEMTNYTKANVLLQAAQAMLAQANQSSSSVLSLLQ